jgi:hypothetical protein
MIYQTKIQQKLFVAVGMIDEFYQTLVSLFCHFSIHLVRYSIFDSQYDSTIK